MNEFNNFNKPLFQSETQPQSNRKRSEHCCLTIFCWLFSIGAWAFVAMLIYYFYPFDDIEWEVCDKRKACSRYSLKWEISTRYIYIGISIYVIYIILELCSPMTKYLCNKHSGLGIHGKMGSFFQTRPTLTLKCECFHTETYTVTVTDSDGNEHEEERTHTVVTYRETYHIPYYCCRDVSGLFRLKADEKKLKKKAFVELELKEEINFAEPISYYDYIKEKNDFRARNEHRDVGFSMSEKIKIEGLIHHHLIPIRNNPPCFANFFWYLFSILLTFGQFYKLYINSLCIYQNFTIRKLISTRYDLSQGSFNDKYDKFIPQIDLITQQFMYEPNTYVYLAPGNKKPIPSNNELSNAQKYEYLIPKYEIYEGNDIYRAGTIKDNKDFISYNDNNNDNNNNTPKDDGLFIKETKGKYTNL